MRILRRRGVVLVLVLLLTAVLMVLGVSFLSTKGQEANAAKLSFESFKAREMADQLPKGWIDIQQEANRLFLVDSQFKNRALSTTQIRELFGEETRIDFIPVSMRDTFVSVARDMKSKRRMI